MKNFNQKSSKNSIEKEKRYSKSKFKNETKVENNAKNADNKVDEKNEPAKIVTDYRSKYEENVKKSGLSFRNIKDRKTVILTAATKQIKGFSVLPKGQCVMVEAESVSDNKSLNLLLRVKAQDGRIGLADFCDIKRVKFRRA